MRRARREPGRVREGRRFLAAGRVEQLLRGRALGDKQRRAGASGSGERQRRAAAESGSGERQRRAAAESGTARLQSREATFLGFEELRAYVQEQAR